MESEIVIRNAQSAFVTVLDGCGSALSGARFTVLITDGMIATGSGLLYGDRLCGAQLRCHDEPATVLCWRCAYDKGVAKRTEAEHAEIVFREREAYSIEQFRLSFYKLRSDQG